MRNLLVGVLAAILIAAFYLGVGRSRSSPVSDEASDASGAIANNAPSPIQPGTPDSTPPRAAPASRPLTPAHDDGGTQGGPRFSSTEDQLMRRLRGLSLNSPAEAVELAREGNRRFPHGPDAPERSSILVHALAAGGQASAARGEAERMVNEYPDSAWVREVEAFSGAHRHRNLRVNDAGQLEYE